MLKKIIIFITSVFIHFGAISVSEVYANEKPVNIILFGDSLSSGYGLPPEEGLAPVLEKLLNQEGINSKITNMSVAGDTTANGLSRQKAALSKEADLVILALGANDMLRGVQNHVTASNLDQLAGNFTKSGSKLVIVGMKASLNLGVNYARRFDSMFKTIARKHNATLVPFMLEGVAMNPDLNLADGIHPNAKGIEIIANNILPAVKESLENK